MADEIEERARLAFMRVLLEEGCFDKTVGECTVSVFRKATRAALHAHGYKITKDDSDMLSIPEVSTDRPIGR